MAAIRRQLGIFMGKTHMVEFAFGGTGQNHHWGAPRNPWDANAHRSPGGSSSGAGVSLIEGSALVALGSDTAGSVRIPASMTGTVGVKVTLGRWSAAGVVPLSPSFDTPGFLARSAADAAYIFAAIDPAAPRIAAADIAGLRIGIGDPLLWGECDPGIAEGAKAALDALAAKGAVLREGLLPEAKDAYDVFLEGGFSAIELRNFLDHELPDWLDELDPIIAALVKNAEKLSAREYLARLDRMRRAAPSARARLQNFDVIASPTLCVTPPLMAQVGEADSHWRVNRRIVRNTVGVNYLRPLRDHLAGGARPGGNAGRIAVHRRARQRGAAPRRLARRRARPRHRARAARACAARRVTLCTQMAVSRRASPSSQRRRRFKLPNEANSAFAR